MYRGQLAVQLSFRSSALCAKSGHPMVQVRSRTHASFAASQTGANADPDLKQEEERAAVNDEIERALKSASAAADSAESALDKIQKLPSSRSSPQVCSLSCFMLVVLSPTRTPFS